MAKVQSTEEFSMFALSLGEGKDPEGVLVATWHEGVL